MDSLLIAVAVGLVVWLLMRRLAYARARAKMAARQQGAARGAEGASQDANRAATGADADTTPGEGKHMPRLGIPGTITRTQIAQLRENYFEPVRQWSKEEAQLILDTVSYFRAVILDRTGDKDPPLEVQNKLLAILLTDDEMREGILDWSRNRVRGDEIKGRITLPRDGLYDRVSAEVDTLWENGSGAG